MKPVRTATVSRATVGSACFFGAVFAILLSVSANAAPNDRAPATRPSAPKGLRVVEGGGADPVAPVVIKPTFAETDRRGSSLPVHEWLRGPQYLQSESKRFRASIMGSGELSIYDGDKPIWTKGVKGAKGSFALAMQPDANLVLYQYADAAQTSRIGAVWESVARPTAVQATGGQCYVKLLDTGVLAIYAGKPGDNTSPVWTSGPPVAGTQLELDGIWYQGQPGVRNVGYEPEHRVTIERTPEGLKLTDAQKNTWFYEQLENANTFRYQRSTNAAGQEWQSAQNRGTIEFLNEADAVRTTRANRTVQYLTRWPDYGTGLALKGLYQVRKDTSDNSAYPDSVNQNMTSSGSGGPDRVRKIFGTTEGTFTSFYRKGNWEQTIIVASDDTHVVVAFRGSDYSIKARGSGVGELLDMLNPLFGDLKFSEETLKTLSLHEFLNGEALQYMGIPGPWPNFGGLMVHAGWSTAATEAYDLIVPEMRKQGAARKTIIIAGHSMGGAVSGYFTYRLMRDAELLDASRSHQLVTVGAPRFAADGFPSKFNELATKYSLRVSSLEMTGDPTPETWRGYFSTEFMFGQRIGVLGVYRLGGIIDTWTPKFGDNTDTTSAAYRTAKHLIDNYVRSVATGKICDHVRLTQKGGYWAKFTLTWVRPDGVAESWESGRTTAGWSSNVPVPKGATKVHLKAEVDMVFGAWRTFHDQDIAIGNYTSWGITSNAFMEKD